MSMQLKSFGFVSMQVAAPLMLSITLLFGAMDLSQAAQTGHGRVISALGAPLEVSVPVRNLTAEDLKVLNVSIADPSAWAQAGLTMPAAIETLSVSVEPGLDSASRNLVFRSSQVVNRPVIDVLLSLKTALGTTVIQSSYLVLTKESSTSGAGSVQVVRGDTLYAIALSKVLPGTDIFQVMWAIYEANPQAFISENMNLLRAGSTLNIPDAAAIRAVDAKYARSMFAKHDQSFRARRGAGKAGVAVPVVASTPSQTGSVTTQQPVVSPSSSGDQVRIDSSSPLDQQADARVASANELREMQSRVEALQKNVEELKDALQKSQALATGASGATGSAGSSAPTEAAGSTGAAVSTGAPGAAGTSGSAGTAGAIGPSGAANASDTVANTARADHSGFAKIKKYASDHVLGLVLGVSALLALLIAFLLNRAGQRTRSKALESEPQINKALATDFDQKLQSIDLNLSDDERRPSSGSGSTKSGV